MDSGIIAEQIRTVLLAKAETLIRRDAVGLASLIHPDFLYVNASGKMFDKDSYIDTYCVSGQVVFLAQKVSEPQVRQFESFAIATLVLNDKFVVAGQIVEGCYQSFCVFSAAGAEWQWAGGHTMVHHQS